MFCLSPGSAGTRAVLQTIRQRMGTGILAAAIVLSLASPAEAQIASYVDSHGRLIYINANTPTRTSKAAADQDPLAVTPPPKLEKVVDAAAERNHLDPALVQAVIQTESGWNPYAVSPKGAFGLMQLIPSTAERYGVGDVFDPVQNVNGGTHYLRDLLDRYHGDLKKSLAAYNAGEQAVEKFGGVPAYSETRAYVRKVTNTYFQSGSGHSPTGELQHHPSIREVTDRSGRTVFTNE